MAGRPASSGRSVRAAREHAKKVADLYVSRGGTEPGKLADIDASLEAHDEREERRLTKSAASAGGGASESSAPTPKPSEVLLYETMLFDEMLLSPLMVRPGRPSKLQADEETLRKVFLLASHGSPFDEAAPLLGVSGDCLRRHVKNDEAFQFAWEAGRAAGKASIRRATMMLAHVNPVAMIWAGKVILGHQETQSTDTASAVQSVIRTAGASLAAKMAAAGITGSRQVTTIGATAKNPEDGSADADLSSLEKPGAVIDASPLPAVKALTVSATLPVAVKADERCAIERRVDRIARAKRAPRGLRAMAAKLVAKRDKAALDGTD
jgi:hypothetical protein